MCKLDAMVLLLEFLQFLRGAKGKVESAKLNKPRLKINV